MKLKYKVVNKNGNKIKGCINVDDINDLEIILINFGFKKIYIKEYKASRFRFIKNKMSDKQILIFIKKLIGFLKINASLSQALSLILESSNNKIIQRFIFNILINLNLGSNIVESIKASTLDNRIKINIVVLEMLEILDASGDMIGVLESILNYLSSKLDLENKFKLSTIYPKIVLTIGLVVFTVFMVFIVPSYKEMFVRDYITWIVYEGSGSPRLNKVARNIIFTYCPFSKEIRAKLRSNPLYKDILDRYDIRTSQKLHHMDNLYQKLQNSRYDIPNEIAIQRRFLES